jgi:hypothetical protein
MNTNMKQLFAALTFLAGLPHFSAGGQVILQQPTATFSQTSFADFLVGTAINGTVVDGLGWAIQFGIGYQVAAFETATDIGYDGGSLLTFTLTHAFTLVPEHTLGRFRLSVTTDDRNSFADGLPAGGDVTANWAVLDPISFTSAHGAMLSELADYSILASGPSPDTDLYTVIAATLLTGITGVRLEALQDPSLPFNGPGRQPQNGNFVLSEFEMSLDPIPEPSAWAILTTAGLLWAAGRRMAPKSVK